MTELPDNPFLFCLGASCDEFESFIIVKGLVG